jgi:NADH-quinone oxidoreductase subunit N
MLSTPSLNYNLLAPILIVLGGALLGVLVEGFIGRAFRARIQIIIALATTAIAFGWVISIRGVTSQSAAIDSVSIDGAGLFMQGAILALSFVALLFFTQNDHFAPQASALPGSVEEADAIRAGVQMTEIYPLVLFAISGMLLFPVAHDLITLFVALEVLSIPLYIITGLARRRRLLSQEAALKYFLLGAYSSAFFLFGGAFLYGFSGSLSLGTIRTAAANPSSNHIFLFIGVLLVSVGLLFKVGAVPFHSWTPDVYQGAPTAVTGFMAACTKVAAFGAMFRIFIVGFGAIQNDWRPIFVAISIVTMMGGAIAAISQRDVKRTLAYSSITHAGFLLAGIIALSKAGLTSMMFYLVAYGFATIGAFGIVTLVRDSTGEVNDLNRWAGLAKKSPGVATAFSLFLLSFGGIPLTAGFIAKFSIFTAAYATGNIAIVVVGVLSSAIALYFYLRVVLIMFFKEPTDDTVTVAVPSFMVSSGIIICLVITLVLGVYPNLLFDLANTMTTLVP